MMKKGKTKWSKGRAASKHVRIEIMLYESAKECADYEKLSLARWVNRVIAAQLLRDGKVL